MAELKQLQDAGYGSVYFVDDHFLLQPRRVRVERGDGGQRVGQVVEDEDEVGLDEARQRRPDRVGGLRIWVARLDFEPEPAFGAALLRLLNPSLP